MHTTPSSLLERLREPNHQQATREAWDRFVELYTPLLWTWAYRLYRSESDAADLVQDVFALLVRKVPDFRYDQRLSFRAWLHTLLLNQWRDRQRRAAPVPRADLEALAGPSDDDPARAVEEADYRQYLARRALELMQSDFEPRTWKAVWEMAVNGRSAAEVGAELGMSSAAVYAATSRVLRRLRQELAGIPD